MCSDWQLKLQISFAIYLRATHYGFVPKILLSLQEYMSLSIFFWLYYLIFLVQTKTIIHFSVQG